MLRRYSDAWFAAAQRRRSGDERARFPRRRRALMPVRWYHDRFTLTGRRLRIPVARGRPALWVRTCLVSPPRDVTHAAAPITAAPAGPLAGTGPPPPAAPELARESLAPWRGA